MIQNMTLLMTFFKYLNNTQKIRYGGKNWYLKLKLESCLSFNSYVKIFEVNFDNENTLRLLLKQISLNYCSYSHFKLEELKLI